MVRARSPVTDAIAVCRQRRRPHMAIGVAALDTRNTAVDASPDVYGIVHDLPEIMTSAPRRAAPRGRVVPRALKRPEKAHGSVRADLGSVEVVSKSAVLQAFRDGETRTRTGDTTIFSRVLYQLSYLAVAANSLAPRR
jgi:hypothetical protein